MSWFGKKEKSGASAVKKDPVFAVATSTSSPSVLRRNKSEDQIVPAKKTLPRGSSAHDIDESLAEDGFDKDEEAPLVFGKMIRYLSGKDALNTEGLFNPFTGDETEVQSVKRAVYTEKDNITLTQHTKDPRVIAEVFKQYVSSLPEPLLTYEGYDSFLSVQYIVDRADKISRIRTLIYELPRGYKSASKELFHLLSQVLKTSQTDAAGLAKNIGPIILKPREVIYYMKEDEKSIVDLISTIILEYETIFANPLTVRKLQGSESMESPVVLRSENARPTIGPATYTHASVDINSSVIKSLEKLRASKENTAALRSRLERLLVITDQTPLDEVIAIAKIIRDVRKDFQEFFDLNKLTPPPDPSALQQAQPKVTTEEEKLDALRRMLVIYIGSLIDHVAKLEEEITKPTQDLNMVMLIGNRVELIHKKLNNIQQLTAFTPLTSSLSLGSVAGLTQ